MYILFIIISIELIYIAMKDITLSFPEKLLLEMDNKLSITSEIIKFDKIDMEFDARQNKLAILKLIIGSSLLFYIIKENTTDIYYISIVLIASLIVNIILSINSINKIFTVGSNSYMIIVSKVADYLQNNQTEGSFNNQITELGTITKLCLDAKNDLMVMLKYKYILISFLAILFIFTIFIFLSL